MKTILQVVGSDHLPSGRSYGTFGNGHGIELSGFPWTIIGVNSDRTPCVLDDKFFGCLITGSGNYGFSTLLRNTIPANTPRVAIGFRIRVTAEGVAELGERCVVNPSVTASTSIGGTSGQAFVRGSDIPEWTLGKEYHFEIEIVDDGVARPTIYRYRDGELIGSDNFSPSTLATAYRNGTLWMGFTPRPAASTAGALLGFKDFIISSSNDINESARLGPVRLVPIGIDSTVGSDWTTSNSEPVTDVLNTPFPNAGDLSTPHAISPLSLQELHCKLSSGLTNADEILAVKLLFGGKLGDTSAERLAAEISLAEESILLGDLALTTSWTYGIPSPILNVSPKGTPWNGNDLDNTVVKIKPGLVV